MELSETLYRCDWRLKPTPTKKHQHRHSKHDTFLTDNPADRIPVVPGISWQHLGESCEDEAQDGQNEAHDRQDEAPDG